MKITLLLGAEFSWPFIGNPANWITPRLAGAFLSPACRKRVGVPLNDALLFKESSSPPALTSHMHTALTITAALNLTAVRTARDISGGSLRTSAFAIVELNGEVESYT